MFYSFIRRFIIFYRNCGQDNKAYSSRHIYYQAHVDDNCLFFLNGHDVEIYLLKMVYEISCVYVDSINIYAVDSIHHMFRYVNYLHV